MARTRLDRLLVERGLFNSRERAKTAILGGSVFANGVCADKPGVVFESDCELEVRGETLDFVSRGGLKLAKALTVFHVDISGVTALDVGASTGGFTDCMLKNGAAKVCALDVGSGQLAPSLCDDPRVVAMENTNIREVSPEIFDEKFDFATVDVSFISLKLVLPCLKPLLRDGAKVVALVKPQFEAGRGKVGKKGVVRDEKTHREVLDNFILDAQNTGFSVLALDYSPVRGAEGNVEFLALLKSGGAAAEHDTAVLVKAAHRELNGGTVNA